MALPWRVSCHSVGVLLFSGFRCLENGYWTWPWWLLSSVSFFRLLFGRKGRAVCWVMCGGIGLQYGSMCGGIGLQYMTSVCISSWWGLDSRGSFLVHSRSLGLSRLLGICWAQWRPATCWGPSIEWDPPPPGFPALFLIHRNQALALRSGPGSFSAGEVLNKHILNALIPDLSKAF